jgi:hypothetical protein
MENSCKTSYCAYHMKKYQLLYLFELWVGDGVGILGQLHIGLVHFFFLVENFTIFGALDNVNLASFYGF